MNTGNGLEGQVKTEMWMRIRIWCFELFLSYMWMMSRNNNLIHIQTTITKNYSSLGNSYTLDQ